MRLLLKRLVLIISLMSMFFCVSAVASEQGINVATVDMRAIMEKNRVKFNNLPIVTQFRESLQAFHSKESAFKNNLSVLGDEQKKSEFSSLKKTKDNLDHQAQAIQVLFQARQKKLYQAVLASVAKLESSQDINLVIDKSAVLYDKSPSKLVDITSSIEKYLQKDVGETAALKQSAVTTSPQEL
jgi:Skp family chaperone for outer membrane proteins